MGCCIMKIFIIMIIIIFVAGTNVHAMKPFCGSVIHEWNKQFELSKGISSCASLGKEKPTAIYLSRVPEPVQPGKLANLNDENAVQKVAQLEQSAPKRAAQSGENTSHWLNLTKQNEKIPPQRILQAGNNVLQGVTKTEEAAQPVLAEFHHLIALAQHPLDLPDLEDLYCRSELWGCFSGSAASCSACLDSSKH